MSSHAVVLVVGSLKEKHKVGSFAPDTQLNLGHWKIGMNLGDGPSPSSGIPEIRPPDLGTSNKEFCLHLQLHNPRLEQEEATRFAQA